MFEPLQVAEAIQLQQRSFALLKWVQSSLHRGGLSFSVVHSSMDTSAAALEWLARHRDNVPLEARPTLEQLPAFARLFVSYLTTSYQLSPAHTRVVSDCGCYCTWCAYLKSSPTLLPRTPSKKDAATAKELKRLYVGQLALELDVEQPSAAVERVVEASAGHAQVALATWMAELLRRMEFASQGEAVLSLWREFAWREGAANRKFRLTAESVLAAEQHVIAALRAASGGEG